MTATFRADKTWVRAGFVGDGVIRVRVCLGEDQPPQPSYALLPGALRDLPCAREERSDATLFRTDEATLSVAADLSLTVLDARGRRVHRDVPGRAYRRDPLGRSQHTFAVDGFYHVYGLGERAGALNRFGQSFHLDMRDAIGYDASATDPLYKQIPFFIRRDVAQGLYCGLFYDALCRGEVDFGRERSGYWPRYCTVTLESPQMDYYIILGDSLRQVVRRYTDLTGKTAMPPLASLGHMASTMYLTELDAGCDDAILDFIRQLHARGFGCDGYHLSSGYTARQGKRCVFTWNSARFPDPEAFARSLTDAGMLLSPNVKPALLTTHPLYGAFAEAGAFLTDADTGKPYLARYWGGMASYVDMLSPSGYALWVKHLREKLLDIGVNAVWNDNNEYEMDDDRARTAGDARPAYAVRPAFSNRMAEAAREALAQSRPNKRPYILTRSGYAGIQRLAQTWAGDNRSEWRALAYNIPIMLGMGLSGVANQGCDIGGFAGPAPDGELFVRWVQNGVFQPRFCLHSCNDDNTVTLPWSYEEYTPYVLSAFRLRYALAPYLYGLMRQAATAGDPIMRPMAYAFDDAELADESFDFMLGDALLVANVVTQGATTRSVRLPRGCDWLDWDTNARRAGGQTVTVDAPLSKIPLFRRSGSLIPLAEPALRLTPDVFRRLTLLAEASAPCAFTLYQDDGVSRDFERGLYLETRITLTPEPESITLAFRREGDFRDGVESWEVRLDGRFNAPLQVRLGDAVLPQALSREEYERATGGAWYFSLLGRRVFIRFDSPATDFDLTADYRVRDLIGM